MSHTPLIPEGSGGGTRATALPHTLLIPEGSRGGAKSANNADAGRARNCGMACESCSKFQKDKMLSIFPVVLFSKWEKDKMLSIFSLLIFHAMRRYGIAIAPERQPEWHCYCNP